MRLRKGILLGLAIWLAGFPLMSHPLAYKSVVHAQSTGDQCRQACADERGRCEAGIDDEYQLCLLDADHARGECYYGANQNYSWCEMNCPWYDPDCLGRCDSEYSTEIAQCDSQYGWDAGSCRNIRDDQLRGCQMNYDSCV